MLVPRRVRRRLLLPPGWVALGFLLLLGCQALRPWKRQLKPSNVIRLTLPALHQDKTALWSKIFYQSRWQLNRLRPWRNTQFKGCAPSDSLNAAATELAVQKIMADKSHAGGVRIRFLPGATYANLVRVLDIMDRTGQRKYWSAIRHQPITLYAITDKVMAVDKKMALESLDCLLCNDVIRNSPIPVASTVQQLLAEFWQRLQSLEERVWRQPLLLLLAISGLSLWRLLPKTQHYLIP